MVPASGEWVAPCATPGAISLNWSCLGRTRCEELHNNFCFGRMGRAARHDGPCLGGTRFWTPASMERVAGYALSSLVLPTTPWTTTEGALAMVRPAAGQCWTLVEGTWAMTGAGQGQFSRDTAWTIETALPIVSSRSPETRISQNLPWQAPARRVEEGKRYFGGGFRLPPPAARSRFGPTAAL